MSSSDTEVTLKALVVDVLAHGANRTASGWTVRRRAGGAVPPTAIDFLRQRGLVCDEGDRAIGATAEGRTVLETMRGRPDADLALATRPSNPILSNASESPVARLAQGSGFLAAPEVAAADRLRADFKTARMMPRLGVDWSVEARGGPSTGERHEDVMLAARERLHGALRAVGPDLQGILTDVCCLLIGLSDAERKYALPQRSGKVVLRLGLRALARHYGLRRG